MRVPTIRREDVRYKRWWARRQERLCPPYGLFGNPEADAALAFTAPWLQPVRATPERGFDFFSRQMRETMSTRTVAAAIALTFLIVTLPAHAQGQNPRGVNPTHYQCYEVTSIQGDNMQNVEVKLRDQFGRSQVRLQKANYICAPVQKNDSRPSDSRTHLVCYVGFEGQPLNRKVQVQNQFGKQVLGVGKPVFVCAPSLKAIVN
jgi:hypothetical protein